MQNYLKSSGKRCLRTVFVNSNNEFLKWGNISKSRTLKSGTQSMRSGITSETKLLKRIYLAMNPPIMTAPLKRQLDVAAGGNQYMRRVIQSIPCVGYRLAGFGVWRGTQQLRISSLKLDFNFGSNFSYHQQLEYLQSYNHSIFSP